MRSKLLPVFIIFFILVAATVGAWIFLSHPDDAQIMQLALRNMSHISAARYRFDVSLAADRPYSNTELPLDLVMRNTGTIDLATTGKPAIHNEFDAHLYVGGVLYPFRGDFRRAMGVSYINFAESSSFGLINLADVLGKWFAIPSLWDAGPITSQVEPTLSSIGAGDVFENAVRLPDDRIDGRAVYHLRAKINLETLELLTRLAALSQGNSVREADDAARFVRTRLAFDSIDLYVTRWGFDLYRAQFTGSMHAEQFPAAHFIARVELRNHNRAVMVDVPAVAPSIETVLSPIGAKLGVAGFETGTLKSQLPNIPPLGPHARDEVYLNAFTEDTDRDGLTNLMEQVYGTDALNPDSDGDSFGDGAEVAGKYNPNGLGKLPE